MNDIDYNNIFDELDSLVILSENDYFSQKINNPIPIVGALDNHLKHWHAHKTLPMTEELMEHLEQHENYILACNIGLFNE